MVVQADSTLTAIRQKVRRLTASASESALTTNNIDLAINTFYSQDFPYGIKLDQMRSVYTFYTEPYRDRYPLDVNYNQGVRSPIYFEGVQGFFFKDRQEFYNMWPRWPTKFNPINGDGVTTSFQFTLPGPFLDKEVVLGGVDSNGDPISVADDGNGNLQLQVPNPVVSVPPQYTAPTPAPTAILPTTPGTTPIPGMHNLNTDNPGLNSVNTNTFDPITTVPYPGGIGTVNYVSGQFSIRFPVPPASGTQITVWIVQYQTGRPYSLLFWNNEFHIRPIPKLIHKVEVETYLTPTQFMETSDNPILNQWWQYIAYGAACEILRERQDMDGLSNLMEGFKRQEALVLERQGVEEINQQNLTIYNNTNQNNGNWGNNYQGWY